jgi:hypothetical protein
VGRNVQRGKLWPGRSAHDAVDQAQAYAASGRSWVVDIDLAKFFDRVNHDRLMAKAAERIADKRVLRLIRALLTAGALHDGRFEESREGAPPKPGASTGRRFKVGRKRALWRQGFALAPEPRGSTNSSANWSAAASPRGLRG